MYRRFYFFLFILLLPFLFSCSDDAVKDDEKPLIAAGEKAQRLLFLYVVGDNNLSSNVQDDLKEVLAAAASIPNDCFVLAFVDDYKGPRILRYFNNKGKGDYETVYNFERETASCSAVDMLAVFNWVEEFYPAENVDIVLWSHGTGWLYDDNRSLEQFSFGYDSNTGGYGDYKRVYIEELASVLRGLKVKPDRILFDACFMQCIEVVYALRECANWLIASPAEIPAPGAPYAALLPLFFDASAGIQDILSAYKSEYDGTSTGVILSAVRCSAVQSFADATAVAVSAGFDTKTSPERYNGIFSYLPEGESAGSVKVKPCFYDINSAMKFSLPIDKYNIWRAALNELIPYKIASEKWYSELKERTFTVDESYSGVSMYIPKKGYDYENLNYDFLSLEWYKAAGWNVIGW